MTPKTIVKALIFALFTASCTGDGAQKDAQTLAQAVAASRINASNGYSKDALISTYVACITPALVDLKDFNPSLYSISVQSQLDNLSASNGPTPKTLQSYRELLSKASSSDGELITEADRRFQTYASYCSDGKPLSFQWYMDPRKGLLKYDGDPNSTQTAVQAATVGSSLQNVAQPATVFGDWVSVDLDCSKAKDMADEVINTINADGWEVFERGCYPLPPTKIDSGGFAGKMTCVFDGVEIGVSTVKLNLTNEGHLQIVEGGGKSEMKRCENIKSSAPP